MTPDQKIHVQYLLSRYLNGTISTGEEQNLFQYIDEEKDNTDWQELLEEFMASEQDIIINKEEYQPILDSVLGKRTAKVRRMGWIKWVAAACIIAAVGVLTWHLVGVPANEQGTKQTAQTHDVGPGSFKARLTLADGTVIVLDSAASGELTKQGNTTVINKNGQILYQSQSNSQQLTANSPVSNTLSTANGESYSVTLSDGTKVWLNAASSIKYPVAFNGTERRVEITGEAYFEVKHNAAKPFKVLVNGMEVQDLGTEFNINAYTNEPEIRTTLVSGKVRVSPAGGGGARREGVDLKPGQQAILIPNSKFQITNGVDLEKITSWKNNEFNFSDDNMETIMRQLARWYNIQPVITAPSQSNYTGRITRNVPLSEVLKMFERVGYVKFEIRGNVVRVIPTQ